MYRKSVGASSRVRKAIRRVEHAKRRENISFDDSIQLFIQLKCKVVTIEELGELEPAVISNLNELYQDEFGYECPWFNTTSPDIDLGPYKDFVDVSPERPELYAFPRDDNFEQLALDAAMSFTTPVDIVQPKVLPPRSASVDTDEGITIEECVFKTGDTLTPTISFGIPCDELELLIGGKSGLDIPNSPVPSRSAECVPLQPLLNLHSMKGRTTINVPLHGLKEYYEFSPSAKLTIEDLLYDNELTQLQKAFVSASGARHASIYRHQTRTKLARVCVDVFGSRPTPTKHEISNLVICMANAAEQRGRIVAGTTTLRIAAAWFWFILKEFRLNRLGRYMPDGSKYDAYRITPQDRSRSGRLKKPKSRH